MQNAFPRPQLVCFSHLRWDFVYQRPQHLMSRAAGFYDVLFVEEPVHQDIDAAHLEARERGDVTVLVPILPHGTSREEADEATRSMLKDHLGPSARGRVLWYYTPMAMAFSRDIAADVIIYDNMDELSAFLGAPPHLLAFEEALFERADLVFTGGMSLYAAKRQRHHSVHAFPSSVDVGHFADARKRRQQEPADQASIPHPRVGFFGVVDERMDVELLGTLARLRPDWHFVIVGPVVKINPALLPQGPNVHWLGAQGYNALPDYLAGWDVGLMPFALNEATRFISPTKTPEFLAAGVPVVSTPIADVIDPYGKNGLVEIARDAADAAAKLSLLMSRPRAAWLQAVDAHLATISWDRTWAAMDELIDSSRHAQTRGARAGGSMAAASAQL